MYRQTHIRREGGRDTERGSESDTDGEAETEREAGRQAGRQAGREKGRDHLLPEANEQNLHPRAPYGGLHCTAQGTEGLNGIFADIAVAGFVAREKPPLRSQG